MSQSIHRMMVLPEPVGPPLHSTQVRAYALIAAAQMTDMPGFHPHPDDLAAWEQHVLEAADRFVDYIIGGA